jgi:hypothetical protein
LLVATCVWVDAVCGDPPVRLGHLLLAYAFAYAEHGVRVAPAKLFQVVAHRHSPG